MRHCYHQAVIRTGVRAEQSCLTYVSMILGDVRKSTFSFFKPMFRIPARTAAHPLTSETTSASPLVADLMSSLNHKVSIHDPQWWWRKPLATNQKLSIVVVGNGPVGRIGEIVDSADLVVRINQAKLDGFAEFVGTRTDVRVTSPETLLDTDSGTLGGIPHLVYNPTGLDFQETVGKIVQRFPQHLDVKGVNVQELTERKYLRRLKRYIRCRGRTLPTTGAAAVQWALDAAGERHSVSLCGFTVSDDIRGPLWAHYWDSETYLESLADLEEKEARSNSRGAFRLCDWLRRWATVEEHNHDMERERAWLRSLASARRLRILSDDINR